MASAKKKAPVRKAAPKAGKRTGRPSSYKSEYANIAFRHCLLGSDNEGLAKLLSVSLSTIEKWIRDVPDFTRAVHDGREGADAYVAQAMYHRALGYSHPETKTFQYGGEIITHTVTKHYPPDTGAAMNWLKNRQRQWWSDRVEVEHSGSVDLASVLAEARKRLDGNQGSEG